MAPVPHDTYKALWIIWLAFFCIVEFIAVKRAGTGDTFSEFVWWIIGSGEAEREWYRWAARAFVLGLLLWLVPHFFTKWKWW
jgi:hypothetical protein